MSNKVQCPMYLEEPVMALLDQQRKALAENLGVSNISRGDYITRLIKEADKKC